eukprot:524361_1
MDCRIWILLQRFKQRRRNYWLCQRTRNSVHLCRFWTWNPHKNPIPHQLNKELRSGCSALYDKGMGLNKASEPSDKASTSASTNKESNSTKRTQNASTNKASKPTKRTQKASTNNNNKVEFNDDCTASELNCTVVRGKKRIANQKRGSNKRCRRK